MSYTERVKVIQKIKQKLALSKLFRRLFYHHRFVSIDFGERNTINVHHDNKIIGKSIITIRKGSQNSIHIGKGGKFNNLSIDIAGNNNQIILENNIKFSGKLLIVGNDLVIKIGENTTAIGCYVLSRDKSVLIGKNCMISRGVEIRSTDVHKIYNLNTNERLNTATDNILINDRVWIAANVTISKNVQVPAESIIAAGSFVNKSFSEKNCIIAGSPAKIVKTNIRWER